MTQTKAYRAGFWLGQRLRRGASWDDRLSATYVASQSKDYGKGQPEATAEYAAGLLDGFAS